METIKTKYGSIVIVLEYGKKKIDFEKSRFETTMNLFRFLNDKELLKNVTS